MEIDIILNEFASPHDAVELGLLAESYGLRGVWSSNYTWGRDPFFTLSLLADRSSKIRAGPMAVSPSELHPLKMANLLFSLNELSNGRAMLMLSGGGGVMRSIGMQRDRMIRRTRECLEILKGASPDKMMNYKGEIYQVYGYQPKWHGNAAPLIYLGSNHPQSRKLSAELADGLMTSDFVVPMMKDFIDSARTDLKTAGRPPKDFRFSNFWAWHIKKDPQESRAEARRELMLRGWLREKYFAPFLDEEELATMSSHEQDFLNAFLRRSDVIENVPPDLVDKMIENISFVGGLDQVDAAIDTLKQFADIGLTEIALRVHDSPADAIRLIGERVLPALQ